MQFAFTGKTSVSLQAAFRAGDMGGKSPRRCDGWRGYLLQGRLHEEAYGAAFEVEMLLNLLRYSMLKSYQTFVMRSKLLKSLGNLVGSKSL